MPGFRYRNDFNGDQELSIEGGFEYRSQVKVGLFRLFYMTYIRRL